MKLYWGKKAAKKKRQSVFGGQVRSQEEIKELGDRIKHHEKKAGEAAEAQLEEELKDV